MGLVRYVIARPTLPAPGRCAPWMTWGVVPAIVRRHRDRTAGTHARPERTAVGRLPGRRAAGGIHQDRRAGTRTGRGAADGDGVPGARLHRPAAAPAAGRRPVRRRTLPPARAVAAPVAPVALGRRRHRGRLAGARPNRRPPTGSGDRRNRAGDRRPRPAGRALAGALRRHGPLLVVGGRARAGGRLHHHDLQRRRPDHGDLPARDAPAQARFLSAPAPGTTSP